MLSLLGRVGSISSQAVARVTPRVLTPVCDKLYGHSTEETDFIPAFEPRSKAASSTTVLNRITSPDLLRPSSTLTTQSRFAHTDVCQVPSFAHARRSAVLKPHATDTDECIRRRTYDYMIIGAGLGLPGLYAGKEAVHAVVKSLWLAADTVAAGSVEVDLNEIPEGKHVTYKWRGKPLFIRHRTPAEIEAANNVSLGELRHPEADADRIQRPEWLITIGVCTHLGCVPIPFKGDYGGYYCPCHGSHYDTSARIRKGPAPENLEIPTYEFLSDDRLFVGDVV